MYVYQSKFSWGFLIKLVILEGKSAYPYITEFKKEPFRSYALLKRREIKSFYFSEYSKVASYYSYFNKNLLQDKTLNLENIYWFLLLRKYLKEEKKENQKELFEFIKKCEISKGDQIGFKFAPRAKQKEPDIWSTYFAIASLKMLGLLKEYLASKGMDNVKQEIKKFILSHQTNNGFLHCLDKDCEIDKKTSVARTFYFVLELLMMLDVDIRTQRSKFLSYIGARKRDPSIVFKLLCVKLLDMDSEVKEKEIQYLYDFQKENGGYSFKKINGRINTTFWIVCVLESFSWLLDYNPVGIYSFINSSIHEIISSDMNKNTIKMMELSKLVILLSIIWDKFIEEFERVIFKQLEQENYIDFNQIQSSFGLVHGIEEVISYINRNYNFKLKILNNNIEFNNFKRNLSRGKALIANMVFESIKKYHLVSLKKIHEEYKNEYPYEPLKIETDIEPLINNMMERYFFKGKIEHKGWWPFKKSHLTLDKLIEQMVVSDTEINLTQIVAEKEKLKDYKNTLYNMILKLKNSSTKTREEVESYLLIDEIDIAKERIRYLLHNTLMDAEFLNKNIEQSFNEELYYINLHEALSLEINGWNKQYLILKNRLRDLDINLQAKIEEKEQLRNFSKILDELEGKILNIHEKLNGDLDDFRKFFRIKLEKGYNEEEFDEIIANFDTITRNLKKYDSIIYKVSQQITTKEKKLLKKHKKIIDLWVGIKEELNSVFDYYFEGFRFFRENLNRTQEINQEVSNKIDEINKNIKEKVDLNQFQDAFNIIKKESDVILNEVSNEIKGLQKSVKNEMKSKQKLYLLYRYLPDSLDQLEADILSIVAKQAEALTDKITEEKTKTYLEEFDQYISDQILRFKEILDEQKDKQTQLKNRKINDIIKEFDDLINDFIETSKQFQKKISEYKQSIKDFEEKSNLTIIKWTNFSEFFNNEIEDLKDEFINEIINDKINLLAKEKNTNNIKILDLKKETDLKCNVLMDRIKDMIEISKIDGKLYEKEKCILVFTVHYYRNKELKNYIEKRLLKPYNEIIGKILALYDSSIRHGTLNINMLEIQNRVNDLENLQISVKQDFNKKVNELQIEIESREEYKKTKENFETTIQNNQSAINNIRENLQLFILMQNLIVAEYNKLKAELEKGLIKIYSEKEKGQTHFQLKEKFDEFDEKISKKLNNTQDKIGNELKISLNKNSNSNKLEPELRAFFVKIKNSSLKEYETKREKMIDEILYLKDESFRGKLLSLINEQKIYLSQLLGTLQKRVEDYIDIREFKKASSIIQKRAKKVEEEVKTSKRTIFQQIKEFNKESKGFETKNKYIIDDFEQFVKEFNEIINEKVKSLERLIIKSYVEMTIKAVANQFLTISFLNNELNIKKQNAQDYLIYLISSGELPGKYDPRLGLYYENPEIVENLDEKELDVIKNMNFKIYMLLYRFKIFLRQYYIIFAFFGAVLSISASIFTISGGDITTVLYPVLIVLVIISVYLIKKRKELTES